MKKAILVFVLAVCAFNFSQAQKKEDPKPPVQKEVLKKDTAVVDLSKDAFVKVGEKVIPADAFKLPVVFLTPEIIQYMTQLFAGSDIPSNKVTALWQAFEEQQKAITPGVAPPKK